MAPPGPPKTPSALALRQGGGRRKSRIVTPNEPKPPRIALADLAVPAQIASCQEAVEFWTEYAPKLSLLGMLTQFDVGKFAMACLEWGLYWRTTAVLLREGETMLVRGAMVARPEVMIAARHLKSCSELLAEFGFSPSDRTKIQVPGQSDDPLEAMLRKREGRASA